MALIQFTRNYNDLSTDAGFQFEFYCDRCGNGFQTEFQASGLGQVSNALDAASNLFGGLFGNAANAARNVRSAGWERRTIMLSRLPWKKPGLTSTSANAVVTGWMMMLER